MRICRSLRAIEKKNSRLKGKRIGREVCESVSDQGLSIRAMRGFDRTRTISRGGSSDNGDSLPSPLSLLYLKKIAPETQLWQRD